MTFLSVFFFSSLILALSAFSTPPPLSLFLSLSLFVLLIILTFYCNRGGFVAIRHRQLFPLIFRAFDLSYGFFSLFYYLGVCRFHVHLSHTISVAIENRIGLFAIVGSYHSHGTLTNTYVQTSYYVVSGCTQQSNLKTASIRLLMQRCSFIHFAIFRRWLFGEVNTSSSNKTTLLYVFG